MGWTGIDDTFSSNKDFYQTEILNDLNKGIVVLDTSYRGNRVYSLMQLDDTKFITYSNIKKIIQ